MCAALTPRAAFFELFHNKTHCPICCYNLKTSHLCYSANLCAIRVFLPLPIPYLRPHEPLKINHHVNNCHSILSEPSEKH